MPVITRELHMIVRCANQYKNAQLAPLGLTAFQAPYLLFACHRPGLAQEDFARELHVNRSSAARHLSSLEQAGFLLRQPSPTDKRQLCIYPTALAQAACADIERVNRQWHDLITATLAPAEKEQLEQLLLVLKKQAELHAPAGGAP